MTASMTTEARPKARRGTSNGNAAGSSTDRRRRKEWLLATFPADVALVRVSFEGNPPGELHPVPLDRVDRVVADWSTPIDGAPAVTVEVLPAVRCYRCATLLHAGTVTADRIIPGCEGGTYRRDNLRPACQPCQSFTGGQLAHRNRPKRTES